MQGARNPEERVVQAKWQEVQGVMLKENQRSEVLNSCLVPGTLCLMPLVYVAMTCPVKSARPSRAARI